MAAIPLFWYTNMTAVTSHENTQLKFFIKSLQGFQKTESNTIGQSHNTETNIIMNWIIT